MKGLISVAVRHALLGALAVALSVPVLTGLSRILGVARPPLGGLALLGGSVLLAFAGGGLIGALGARAGLRSRWAVSLLGLVYGLVLCGTVLPLYTDDVLDEMTDRGTELAVARLDKVLEKPEGIWDQAMDVAGHVVQEGAVYVPALALLGWTLVGPALTAPLEVRRGRKAHTGP